MGNSSNSDTSKILEAIQNFLINGDEKKFARKLRGSGHNADSNIYLQTVELIKKIQTVGVSYFLILVQHPSISSNESRCLLTWCSNKVLARFGKMWDKFKDDPDRPFRNEPPDEKQKLNQAFLNTYSKSIGRLDSFSETCLRYIDGLKSLPDTNAKSGFFNIDITNKPFSISSNVRNKKYEISLEIENKYYEQLCSVTNENVPNDLLSLFFGVFVKRYRKKGFQDALVFDGLKDENFELIRNGLIGGVSSKIHLVENSRKLKKYYQVANKFLQLKREENKLGYNDLERFLGVIQTYAMWAYLTGKKAYFYFKADEISNVGIYTYYDSGKEISDENQKEISSLIFRYFDLLYGQIFFSKPANLESVKLTLSDSRVKTVQSAKTILAGKLVERINKDETNSFIAFSNVVSKLREVAKHEGKQLFFNIALGNDEYLRAYFEPLQPRFSKNNSDNKSTRNKWSISFKDAVDEKKLKNEISRVCSLILGNYSFLQEEDVWLCFSFNQKNVIELRYLAKIKDRITYSINELNGFDYINKFTAVSKNLPEVFVAKIYKNKKVLIGYEGNIRLKHTDGEWVLGDFINQHPENPILEAYRKIESRKIQSPESEEKKTEILFRTMDSISKEEAVGAMFVILRDSEIRRKVENYIADMTEVIEMVKDWKLSELKDEEYLYKLAIQDGATIIDYGNDKIEGRKLVSNTDAKNVVFNPDVFEFNGKTLIEEWKDADSSYGWSEYGKWYEWGARRMTGAALAYQFSGEVEVFIISSDGEVFYLDGKNIYKLDRNKSEFMK